MPVGQKYHHIYLQCNQTSFFKFACLSTLNVKMEKWGNMGHWVCCCAFASVCNYHLAFLPQLILNWGHLIRKEVLQMSALFPKERFFFIKVFAFGCFFFFFIYGGAKSSHSLLAGVEKGFLQFVSLYVLYPLQCPFAAWIFTAWQRNRDPISVKQNLQRFGIKIL